MRGLLSQQYPRRKIFLLAGDFILLNVSMITAFFIIYNFKGHYIDWYLTKIIVVYTMVSGLTLLLFYICGLYDTLRLRRIELLLVSLGSALGIVFLIYSALSYLIIFLRPGKILILMFIGLTGLFISIWRLLNIKYFQSVPQRVLFIGKDRTIDNLSKIMKRMSHSYTIVDHWHRLSHNPTLPSLISYSENNEVDLIIYSVHSQTLKQLASSLCRLRFKGKNIYDALGFYQRLTGKFPVYHIDDFWMLNNSQRELFFPKLNANLKRVFDITFVLFWLPVAIPLTIISALAIKLSSKGPVFFIQERLGQNEVPYKLIKLRTMIDNAEQHCGPRWSGEGDPRITRVGKILRKLRLDELPQLINVLKGEMSVVGPRPIRRHFAEILAKEVPYYHLRFLVKPGLTGWAQVVFDYGGSMEGHAEKLKYDLFYQVRQSFWLDLFIILKTIRVMLGFKPRLIEDNLEGETMALHRAEDNSNGLDRVT